jgi:RNA polymerase sigma factor (sigma-70 family)
VTRKGPAVGIGSVIHEPALRHGASVGTVLASGPHVASRSNGTIVRRADSTAAVDAEYARFFSDEFPAVTRVVHGILRDRGRAEEIAQDAFLQLLLNWNKVSRYERPDAWVRRVAIRLAMRSLRRDRMLGLLHLSLPRTVEEAPRDLDVHDAIGRLPGSQRAVIVLYYLEERPTAEIAHILGCSEATARVHLHRARRRLASLLGEARGSDG